MALYVLTHGVGLIVLALLTHRVAPDSARVTLVTGLVGGGLGVLWGALGLLGHRRRAGVVLTLIPVCFVLITQAISGWIERGAGKSDSLLAPALMTLMLATSVGMLLYAFHGNRPPEYYRSRTARRDSSPPQGKEAPADSGKHHSQ